MTTSAHTSRPEGGHGASLFGKILKFVLPPVVSVGLCVVMFRDIDFSDMMHVIRTGCDFRWIVLMLVLNLVPVALRALRWGLQLRAAGIDVPVHVLFYSIFGTYAVNLVFPRLGEVWRCGYVAYNRQARFSEVFGSMIADRFADLLVVGLLTLCAFFVARGQLTDFVRAYPDAYSAILHAVSSPWLWVMLMVVVGAAWLLLARSRSAFAAKVRGFIRGLWDGFTAIARMHGKFQWLGLTAGIWGCYFLGLTLALHSFPLTEQLFLNNGLVLPLVCFVLTSISMGIPSNGGIGPYQTTLLFGLMLFIPSGADAAQFRTVGAALGNVVIAAQTLMFIVGGLVVFGLIALEKHRASKR